MPERGLSSAEKAAFVGAAMAEAVDNDRVHAWVCREPWCLLTAMARTDPGPVKSVFQLACGIYDSNPLVRENGRMVFSRFVRGVLTEDMWRATAAILREEAPRG